MARRRYQRGSLRLTGATNKKWVLIWREDVLDPKTGATSRVQRKTQVGMVEDFPTKPLARRRADVLLAAFGVNGLDYRPRSSVTFREAVEEWKKHIMIHLKEGTQRVAGINLRAHLLPAFGNRPLDSIGTRDVQAFVTKLANQMRPHSVKNVLGVLGGVCKAAKDWGLTPAPWRLEDIKLPRDRRPKAKKAFTVPEVRGVLLRSCQPWRTVYSLAAMAILRGGEILGLHRSDVDLDRQEIRVEWSISPSRVLQSVKTTKAERTIPIAPPLLETLRDYIEHHWRPNPLGLMFCTEEGRPLSHSKLLERHLRPLLRELGIPQRGLHAFRHTATSLLIEEGVPLPLVQAIVGHEDLKTTLGIYAHVIRPEHREAMTRLSNLLCDPVVTLTDRKGLIQ